MSVKFLLGADPEVFVKQGGKHISAHGMIAGTKKAPLPVDKGAVQVDGMALEFNIDPAQTATEFVRNIDTVYNRLKRMIPADCTLDIVPTAYFDPEYIKSQPEEATELGCDPDFDAWTGTKNPRPNASVDFRTGAGHIHIGWAEDMSLSDPDHFEACCMMVKQLDCSLGILSILWDRDTKRRELYGKLGAFRPKSYGVEYRTLSNSWLRSVALKKLVWTITKIAFYDLMNGNQYYNSHANQMVVAAINKGDIVDLYARKRHIHTIVQNIRRELPTALNFMLRDMYDGWSMRTKQEVDKILASYPKVVDVSASSGQPIWWGSVVGGTNG